MIRIYGSRCLEELEENLYALQLDYVTPLTEAQRETILQRLEAFIVHVKSITPEELEVQTKAKWKAYRTEPNTCWYNKLDAIITDKYYGPGGEEALERIDYYMVAVLPPDDNDGWKNLGVKYQSTYYNKNGDVERIEEFNSDDTIYLIISINILVERQV